MLPLIAFLLDPSETIFSEDFMVIGAGLESSSFIKLASNSFTIDYNIISPIMRLDIL